ncbi:hypothetical protein [Mycobacteroides sp. H063]|uniref:hypothetical protein n=1 Tax=Mycobacteroides sp. H063 TaxID=1720570 RepID=UPI0013F4BEB9|nr:hypothetical protein [Mycobacteroides sp. H063]
MSVDNTAPAAWRGVSAAFLARVLDDIARTGGDHDVPDRRSTADAVMPLWPFLIGLVELNCLPGNELHRGVRPMYARLLSLTADRVLIGDARYVAWLAGDIRVDGLTRRRHMRRWDQAGAGRH